jgi:hypothetical protein
MNQATTRREKLRKAAATIISGSFG